MTDVASGPGWFLGLVVCAVLSSRAAASVPGDVSCDGVVDAQDIGVLLSAIGGHGGSPMNTECSTEDVNGDGAVNAADLVALMSLFGSGPPTPVATPTPRAGPVVAFFGVAGADGTLLPAFGSDDDTAVFQRSAGFGFRLVLEAVPGANGQQPGMTVFAVDPEDPSVRPDLQIEATRPLGNGDPGVCTEGGIPGFDPPDFGPTPTVTGALNDFSCAFEVATAPRRACTADVFGNAVFVTPLSGVVQYCLLVTGEKAFPLGETTLVAQVRDVGGTVGNPKRIILRIGAEPIPTVTRTPVFTATSTARPTSSRTSTSTATQRPTATAGQTGTPTSTGASLTPTRTRTPTNTKTTSTGSPSSTPTRPVLGSPTITPTSTNSFPLSLTPTATRTPTITRTSTNTHTVTRTPTRTTTPTPRHTPTVTRTPTPTVPPEPVITFFGVTRADDTQVFPVDVSSEGFSIFERPSSGYNFSIVIEARPGGTHTALGTTAFNSNVNDPTVLPDLQIEVSQPLGENPTAAVCDEQGSNQGGVPPITPPDFSPIQSIANAINDLACRFKNETGSPGGRTMNSCVQFPDGSYAFVDGSSTVQFCGFINKPIRFPVGETLVSARVRDLAGNVSHEAHMVIRIAAP
jgi:hypothetical protein